MRFPAIHLTILGHYIYLARLLFKTFEANVPAIRQDFSFIAQILI